MRSVNWVYLSGCLAIVAFVLTGCRKSFQTEAAEYRIPVDINRATMLNYQPILDSVVYIPLETKDSCLIGDIGKVFMTDSNIIIYDSKQVEILLFDKTGKFVKKIGRKGRAPGEYLFFNEVIFDYNTKLIYAAERYLNQVYVYNLDGELLKQIRSEYEFNSFCKAENGFWLYTCFKENNPEGYNLMLVNENMDTCIAGFCPQNPSFFYATFNPVFSQSRQGKSYFAYPTSNMIYRLEDGKAVPCYQIDFGEKTMPYSILRQMDNRKDYEQLISGHKYFGDIANLFVFKDRLYFTFEEPDFNTSIRRYNAILNMDNRKLAIYDSNYHFLPIPVIYNMLGCGNDFIVYSSHPNVISEEGVEFLKNKGYTVHSGDNPILLLFYLNDLE